MRLIVIGTTGVMFVLFTWMHFGCEEFYEGGLRLPDFEKQWCK
jgi:hypothetical protein